MRDAFGSLTTRGRVLLAGGVTTIVCAVLLAEPLLLGFGVLAVAAPLITVAVMARSRADLTLTRHLSPATVPTGQPATVHLRIGNTGPAPFGYLLLEDTLPFALGSRPRFILRGVGRGWQREVTYQVRSDVRGRYELGPLTVRSADPFGLVEIPRAFRVITPLVVTPRALTLGPLHLSGRRDSAGDRTLRASAAGHAEDVTVREYRMGDDLRRVHWRTSARTGELMVRREEQHSQDQALVYLDTRERAHAGQGAASSLEAAVTIAASAASYFVHSGWSVNLLTDGGLTARANSPHELVNVLGALAGLELSTATSLDPRPLSPLRSGGLVLAVLGAQSPTDSTTLARLGALGSPALAFRLDVSTWGRPHPETGPGDAMTGWRSVPVARDTTLSTAWRELSVRPMSHGRAGGRR